MGFNYNKRTAEHFAKHPLPFGGAPPGDVEQPKADTPEEADKPQQRRNEMNVKLTPSEEVHIDAIAVQAAGGDHVPVYCERKAEAYEAEGDWARACAWWNRAADVTTGHSRRSRYEEAAKVARARAKE